MDDSLEFRSLDMGDFCVEANYNQSPREGNRQAKWLAWPAAGVKAGEGKVGHMRHGICQNQ